MRSRSLSVRSRNLRRRKGFTLLEVILAVGIAVVLVFAIYQSTVMYYVQTEAGREIAERAQLVRALSARMQADLQTAFTDWKPMPASQSDEETATYASTGNDDVPAGGVLGYADSLTVITQGMPLDVDFSPNAAESLAPKSDVRMIRYFLVENEEGKTGLARESYDQIPDPSLGISPDPARQDLIAPEVRKLEIEYYDGSEWLSEWTVDNEMAPLAIRMRLGFASMGGNKSSDADPSGEADLSAPLESYVFTVTLPHNMAAAASGQTGVSSSGSSDSSDSAGNAEGGSEP